MKKRHNPSNRFLIEQYKSGVTNVMPILVKRYHKILCEKAYWVTKNKESAKDIAQESWLTIIDKIHNLKNVDSFESWAFRIVYTKAVDSIKLNIKESRNLKSIKVDTETEGEIEDNKILVQRALLKAINQLPKEKQDIVRLFYSEEYSINEISTFLNIPIGTVKSRLFKAREKLKSLLKN